MESFFFLSSGTAVWWAIVSLHLRYQQHQGANATNGCQNRDLFPCSHGPRGSPAQWQQGKLCIAISCAFPIQRPCSQVLVQEPSVIWEWPILLENISSNCKCLFSLSFQVFSKEPEKDFFFFFLWEECHIFVFGLLFKEWGASYCAVKVCRWLTCNDGRADPTRMWLSGQFKS